MKSIGEYICLNPTCVMYAVANTNNLFIDKIYGKRTAIRSYRCKSCGKTFTERINTIYYHSRINTELISAIIEQLRQGKSTRQIAQHLQISKNTVHRYSKLLRKYPN